MFKHLIALCIVSILSSCDRVNNDAGLSSKNNFQSDDGLLDATNYYDSMISYEDLDKITSLYDENCIMLPAEGNRLNGKKEVNEFFKNFFARNESIKFTSVIDEVVSKDEWAIEKSRFNVSLTRSENQSNFIRKGRHVIYRRKNNNGEWKITYEAWTVDKNVAVEDSGVINLQNTR